MKSDREARYRVVPPPEGAPPANVFRVEDPEGVLHYAYEHPHPSVSATVVVRDPRRDAFLLVRRATEPFAGQYVFPGGFLDVGRERIEETAAREAREEAGVVIRPDQLELVDVRSDPKRDPRDQVIDVGYYAEVDGAEAAPGDETDAVLWARAEEVAAMPLAFDHAVLWRNVQEHLRKGGKASKCARS